MGSFSLSASCHRSHRDVEGVLEYPDFLDKNGPLDRDGLISNDDDCAISLPRDGGLEIGTEGESCSACSGMLERNLSYQQKQYMIMTDEKKGVN